MVWKEWWPYDPIPDTTETNPYLVNVEKNKVYWWCSCGRSKLQPWCDGCSHKGTGFKPIMFIPQRTGRKLLCGCKQGEMRPLCNGSHLWMKCQHKTPQAAASTFAVSFAVGVFFTWLFHP